MRTFWLYVVVLTLAAVGVWRTVRRGSKRESTDR